MHIKTQGIVLRQTSFKDTDKILTIFCRENGKISAMAKGAKRTKSPIMGSTQMFCYSDFVLFKGRNFYHINQGEVLNSFYSLREDLFKLAYGSYILEIVEAGINEGESNETIFLLVLKTLKTLSLMEGDFLKLLLAFQLKFLSFIGYKPQLKSCVICNNQELNEIRFNITQGGIICSRCKTSGIGGERTNKSVVNIMHTLLYTKLDSLEDIVIPEELLQDVEKIVTKYTLSHMDRKSFKSLNFIKSISK